MCEKFPKLELVGSRPQINPGGLLKYVYMCVYIYTELIEETGRPTGLIVARREIFGLARTS